MQIINKDLFLEWYIIDIEKICQEISIDECELDTNQEKYLLDRINEHFQTNFEYLVFKHNNWNLSSSHIVSQKLDPKFIKAHTISPLEPTNEKISYPYDFYFTSRDDIKLNHDQIDIYNENFSSVIIDEKQINSLRICYGRDAFKSSYDFIATLVEFIDFSEKLCLFDKLRLPIHEGTIINDLSDFKKILIAEDILFLDWTVKDDNSDFDSFRFDIFR